MTFPFLLLQMPPQVVCTCRGWRADVRVCAESLVKHYLVKPCCSTWSSSTLNGLVEQQKAGFRAQDACHGPRG
ncbi:hypothetical protein AAFF_G00340320 [Aldrovandia affinis]|uniref:Secreted protein n=1 Tax=Aldrovandia affinis TaxID=143900 RepID=A0AAD7SKI2_9TELE|nr:hypothetical protein AAFF_G00340320 [Aldrovandia affinis]